MTGDDFVSDDDRVAALDRRISELEATVSTAVTHDLPLLIGAVRGLVDEEVDELAELPAAARESAARQRDVRTQVDELAERVAALGDVGSEATTKEEKFAAVLAFAFNKRDGTDKVSVTPQEIRGCTGVSRRYAYELVEAMADAVAGCRVRESTVVQTGTGSKRKPKALLVDCAAVHDESVTVNQFTTGGE